ncbi:MAG: hypothetical protein ACOCXT_02100, partial [Candidatus Dojkabacteria bacterium]
MEENNNHSESVFLKNVQRGQDAKILSLNEDKSRITYHCSREHSTSFKNPEEAVRASFYTEL